jgi:hypothetical protein
MFRQLTGWYDYWTDEVKTMRRVGLASRVGIVFLGTLLTCAFARASCGTDVVIISGHVTLQPQRAIVRVQLLYAKSRPGESGEVTVENGTFTIQIPFLTQSRAPLLIGNLLEKCDRKPQTVVVTLLGGNENLEYDRVSLNLAKDFKMADPSAYTPRSGIVLSGLH